MPPPTAANHRLLSATCTTVSCRWRTFGAHPSQEVNDLAFAPDGKTLAAVRGCDIVLFDVSAL